VRQNSNGNCHSNKFLLFYFGGRGVIRHWCDNISTNEIFSLIHFHWKWWGWWRQCSRWELSSRNLHNLIFLLSFLPLFRAFTSYQLHSRVCVILFYWYCAISPVFWEEENRKKSFLFEVVFLWLRNFRTCSWKTL
jgi:hypothetical protein